MALILPGTPAWQKMRDPRDRFKALTEILREESIKKLPDLDLYDRISMAREAYRALAVTSLPVLESRRWDAAHNIHVKTNDVGIAERYKQKAIQRMIDRFIEERLGRQIWAVIWKYRQGGVSTKIAEKFYLGVTRGFGQRALVVAQADPEAEVIFEEKYKFMHKYDPLAPVAGKSNSTELSFPSINGHIRVRTAGGRKGVARGGNNKYIHLSECAFYEKEAYKVVGGLLQGATDPQAMVFMESTANGQAGLFYDTAMEAFNAEKARREGNDPEVETKWEYIFLPWFLEDEAVAGVPFKSEEAKDKFTRGMRDDEKLIQQEFGLTAEQMHWYRIIFDTKSKGETPDAKLMFLQQEFPSRALEAFVAPGSSAFDLPRLVKLTLQAKEPIWRGDITVPGAARGIRPLYDPVAGKFLARTPKPQLTKRVGGPLRVWQRPIAGHRYYSSWDLAQSGSAKADSTEAYIVDYDTRECVAHYMEKGVSNNHLAACRMLSKHYNDAMICPETNFDPSFTASLLDTDRKPFVFWRLQSSESAIKDEASREHGHRTGTSSKPVLVYLLRDALETMPGLFIDKHLLDQMKTFKQVQRTDGSWGYPGAVPGSGTHDDGVIAMGMNLLQMRDRPPMGRSPLSKEAEEEKPKPLNPSDMRKGHMEWEEKYRNEQMDGFY